jgi:hypothetical protein
MRGKVTADADSGERRIGVEMRGVDAVGGRRFGVEVIGGRRFGGREIHGEEGHWVRDT